MENVTKPESSTLRLSHELRAQVWAESIDTLIEYIDEKIPWACFPFIYDEPYGTINLVVYKNRPKTMVDDLLSKITKNPCMAFTSDMYLKFICDLHKNVRPVFVINNAALIIAYGDTSINLDYACPKFFQMFDLLLQNLVDRDTLSTSSLPH